MKEKIIKSILDLLILQLLKNNSLNSNQIIKEINRQFESNINPKTINITLAKLKNNNLIALITGKSYILTQQEKQTRVQMKKDYLRLQKNIRQQLKR